MAGEKTMEKLGDSKKKTKDIRIKEAKESNIGSCGGDHYADQCPKAMEKTAKGSEAARLKVESTAWINRGASSRRQILQLIT